MNQSLYYDALGSPSTRPRLRRDTGFDHGAETAGRDPLVIWNSIS
jgi:hypothetical protein